MGSSRKNRGLEASLRELIGSATSIVVATVAKPPESHPQLGYLVELTAQPSGKFLQARLLFLGTRPNGGSLDPVAVGDEVLVFFPFFDGVPDPNKAIAIAGLNSAKVPLPSSFDNTAPERVHPDGYNFRTAQGDAVAALVRKDFLDDLGTWLGLFDALLLGMSTATTAVQIAGFAATMLTGLSTAFGSPTGFTVNVSGGAPGYRSTGAKSS